MDFWLFLVLFSHACIWCKVEVKVHFSPCNYILKNYPCPIHCRANFVVNQVILFELICFWGVCSVPLLHLFILLLFILDQFYIVLHQILKSGGENSPALFFFKIMLAIFCLFAFFTQLVNFHPPNHGILIGIVLNL